MGARGPVPNRDADLARPRERKGGDEQSATKGIARPVKIPTADREWHPIAKMLWNSLKSSGQSDFYQNSDWAYAYSVCEELSLYKTPRISSDGVEYHKRSPEMLKALLSAMSNLLVTEADRRRVRVELEEPAEEETSAEVVAIDAYKADLGIVR